MTASLGAITDVGTSLGSFSVSAALLELLLEEHAPELRRKQGAYDSDPHWWMPMTLPLDAYCALMGKKGVDEDAASKHHGRIARMMAKFDRGGKHVLGPVDVGGDAYWWDYGQLKLYLRNALRLTEDNVEADAMRAFLGAPQRGAPPPVTAGAFALDASSSAADVAVATGRAERSVLANVRANAVSAEGAVLVNVTAKSITAHPDSIAYNVVDDSDGGLVLDAGDVVTDVFLEDGTKIRQKSNLAHDGGKVWKVALDANRYSFEQIYKMNLSTNVANAAAVSAAAHAELAARL